MARKEEVRLRRVEQYERRMKEKKEKEGKNVVEDIVVQESEMSSVRSSGIIGGKPTKPRNPHGKKSKTDEEIPEEGNEEEDEEELDEATMKRKIVGCINKEEAEAFQNFVREKIIILVEKMKNDKNLIQPLWEFIRSLKLEYDKLRLFKNNGVADVEEIVSTITDTKGMAWRKFLEGKEILDTKDYNAIVELSLRCRLFQEGSLQEKIDDQILGPVTEETKVEIMGK